MGGVRGPPNSDERPADDGAGRDSTRFATGTTSWQKGAANNDGTTL
jgi:hypothetical protein